MCKTFFKIIIVVTLKGIHHRSYQTGKCTSEQEMILLLIQCTILTFSAINETGKIPKRNCFLHKSNWSAQWSMLLRVKEQFTCRVTMYAIGYVWPLLELYCEQWSNSSERLHYKLKGWKKKKPCLFYIRINVGCNQGFHIVFPFKLKE